MKKRLRIIFIAFCISFAIMAALSLYALKQFSSLIEYSEQVDNTHKLISKLYVLESMAREIDIKEQGFMITRDSLFLNEMSELGYRILVNTENLKTDFGKDSVQLRSLKQLRAILVLKRDNIRANIAYMDTARTHRLSPYYYSGKKLRQDAEKYLNLMRNRANATLLQSAREKFYYQEIAFASIRYLLLVFAFITLVLFFFMIRELKRRISYQEALQMKVADLKRSHDELEQIAHAVSHDLQEPLRKIQIFSNRLITVKKGTLDEESTETLGRINNAASRMHELIDDLMNLTSLVKEEQMQTVNLNEILKTVMAEQGEKIREKKATVHIEALPDIQGHFKQVQLLFRSLIENALKFSKEDRPPVISIRSDRINGTDLSGLNVQPDLHFYRITVADNGIGFEDKFINKMFQIFQSLHNKDSSYSGKGIGLAICQRVMVNHGGYILAHGKPEIGATFKLYFPVK